MIFVTISGGICIDSGSENASIWYNLFGAEDVVELFYFDGEAVVEPRNQILDPPLVRSPPDSGEEFAPD